MSINNRRIFVNTGIIYVRLIIVSIIGLISTRLLLKTLGIEDYGIFSVVGGVVSIAAIINTMMVSATNRFITFALGKGDIKKVNETFNVTLFIHFIIAIIVFLLALPIGKWYIHTYMNLPIDGVEKANLVYVFSLLGTIGLFLSVPVEGLLTAQENFLAFSVRDIIIAFLKLSVILFLTKIGGHKVVVYAAMIMCLNFIQTIWNWIYCRNKYREITTIRWVRHSKEYKEILNFSVWTGYGALATIGKTQGANIIINYFFGVLLNSALGIASMVNGMVVMFANSISKAISPQITKNYAQENVNASIELVAKSSKYTFAMLLVPILTFWGCLDYVLGLWLTEIPEYTSLFIKLLFIDALIGALNAGIPDLIFATGKIKVYQLVINTIFLLSLPAAFFVLKFDANPSYYFYTYIIFSIIAFFFRQVILQKLVHFDVWLMVKESYLPSILLFLSGITLTYMANTFLKLHPLVNAFIVAFLIIIMVFVFCFNKSEKVNIINTLLKFRL